jgi:hypothetical protein
MHIPWGKLLTEILHVEVILFGIAVGNALADVVAVAVSILLISMILGELLCM